MTEHAEMLAAVRRARQMTEASVNVRVLEQILDAVVTNRDPEAVNRAIIAIVDQSIADRHAEGDA
ncbi:hypothetical protein [Microbacterium timonense]|uniref:hypothetical protein n=1 Tax=Microbacterium timonense TaxID=2086576 RepID=UPI0011B27193|nr:hypothetical protein [Microbacterium timonense]